MSVLRIKTEGIIEREKQFQVLTGKEVRLAQASALNKGGLEVRKAAVKGTAKPLGIKQKLIRQRIRIKRARAKKLVARVWGGTQGISLMHLKPKEVGGGVQAGQFLVPDGFIATTTNNPKYSTKGRTQPASQLVGHKQVFRRKTDKRYPLDAQKVAIRVQMRKHMISRSRSFMGKDLPRVLRGEYRFRVLRKAGMA